MYVMSIVELDVGPYVTVVVPEDGIPSAVKVFPVNVIVAEMGTGEAGFEPTGTAIVKLTGENWSNIRKPPVPVPIADCVETYGDTPVRTTFGNNS